MSAKMSAQLNRLQNVQEVRLYEFVADFEILSLSLSLTHTHNFVTFVSLRPLLELNIYTELVQVSLFDDGLLT